MSASPSDRPRQRIRVLMVGIAPAVLRELVREVALDAEDVVVVDEQVGRDRIDSAIGRHRPDAVVLGLAPEELPAVCTELHAKYRDLVVLGVASDGRRVLLDNGDASPAYLVESLRVAKRCATGGRWR